MKKHVVRICKGSGCYSEIVAEFRCVANNKAQAHKLARDLFPFAHGFRIGRAWAVKQ